jgi:hypothetical protein
LRVAHLALVEAQNSWLQMRQMQGVVGGDQYGHSNLLKSVEDLEDLARRCGIEVGGGFVGENDGRSIDDRTGNRQALLLAAREGDWKGLFAIGQTDLGQRGLCSPHRFAGRMADDCQRQQHVVEHRAVEQQLAILEDQAELAAQVRNGVPAQ